VLLDGERPEVVDVREGPLTVLGYVDVDGVEPSPGLAIDEVVEGRAPHHRNQRGHKEDERQHAVVEREDAQEAPHVKVAEVVRLVMGVVEDAGDEEAGQDKEQLDAVRPVARHEDDGALDPVGRQHVADEVDQQDHQDGQAPHSVEHRQVTMQVGPRAATRRSARRHRSACIRQRRPRGALAARLRHIAGTPWSDSTHLASRRFHAPRRLPVEQSAIPFGEQHAASPSSPTSRLTFSYCSNTHISHNIYSYTCSCVAHRTEQDDPCRFC
jgi:hypothetical protein